MLDVVLPPLTRSADHGLLWIGLAGLLAASGGRRRRAALRGVASLAMASAIANVPAKLSVRRTRPELRPVPLVRHLRRQPTTWSFPSGHSASAAAFATGVAMEQPLVGAPVALLAAGVAYGRVHTGVHYPGDVVAGLALGVGAALLVRRAWPVRRQGAIGKWPAMAVAMALTLRAAEPVHVDVDGQARTLWTLFAGNGHYHPAGFAPTWRERLDDGCIDVRLVDAGHPLARVRLVLAVLTGRLGRSRVHEQRIVAKLPVRSRQGGLRIARDGEVSDGPGHLLLRAASRTLVVYRPAPG